jgi:hypothetical protein
MDASDAVGIEIGSLVASISEREIESHAFYALTLEAGARGRVCFERCRPHPSRASGLQHRVRLQELQIRTGRVLLSGCPDPDSLSGLCIPVHLEGTDRPAASRSR